MNLNLFEDSTKGVNAIWTVITLAIIRKPLDKGHNPDCQKPVLSLFNGHCILHSPSCIKCVRCSSAGSSLGAHASRSPPAALPVHQLSSASADPFQGRAGDEQKMLQGGGRQRWGTAVSPYPLTPVPRLGCPNLDLSLLCGLGTAILWAQIQ